MATVTVRAVFSNGKFGFDGLSRRRDGDKFQIDESNIQPWMTVVKKEPEPKAAPKAKAKAKAKAGSANAKSK